MTSKDGLFIEEGMVKLFSGCNIMGNDAMRQSDTVRLFSKEHRTLQQSFMRVIILPILRRLARDYEEGNYDGRNKETCKLAYHMLLGLTDDDLYLPFV